ncbi:MAG TPA: UvrD-helicase domain-containing protein, partial [Armatimonadota bacterium]
MLNDAQLEAVTTRVPSVLVSAGAGSGKTRVLTQRYFHLLDERHDGRPLQMDEILTLTFTRKAAQEMRERIGRKLDEEGRLHERRELSRAPIGTIHSFCERVLREHALEAGIDPNFRLLDEAEARTMQENALDSIFEDLWGGPQHEREAIGRLVLDVPQQRLRPALLSIFRTARTRGVAMATLTALPPAPLQLV